MSTSYGSDVDGLECFLGPKKKNYDNLLTIYLQLKHDDFHPN